MKLFNVELLKGKKYMEGMALLLEAGYKATDGAVDYDGNVGVIIDNRFILWDEDEEESDIVEYSEYCELIDEEMKSLHDEDGNENHKVIKTDWHRLV